jgi:hypothetical protein
VFLDIHEVEDGPGGRWARLNHDLQGRGVPDPEAAVQDICLGELYYRFTELLKPELVEAVHGFFTGTGTGTAGAKDFISSLKEPLSAFTETALKFIGGADGAYDPFVREGREPALPPERIAGEWGAFMVRLLNIAAYAGEGGAGVKAAGESAGPWLAELAGNLRDRPPVIAAALGYGVLSLLRPILGDWTSGVEAARLGFDHWNLDRKLREQYQGLGVPEDEARRLTALMKAVLSRTVPEGRAPCETGAASNPGLLGTAIIEENYEAGDFRALLGINFFDDVTWFNKEGFEETLFYGALFFALESGAAFEEYRGEKKSAKTKGRKSGAVEAPAAAAGKPAKPPLPWPERVDIIAGLSEALVRAEKASGYRLDGLLDTLSGGNGGKTGKTGLPRGSKEGAEKR